MDGRITFEGCQGCGACLLTCPTHAIRPAGGRLHALEHLCTMCLECIEVCPVDAVTLTPTPQDPAICQAIHVDAALAAVVCQANRGILEEVGG